jgi:1-acyl-sn-glycerol-3-phosphate acyltransferase
MLARLLIRVATRLEMQGIETIPRAGPTLVVLNHLGDADTAVMLAALPRPPDALGRIGLLFDFPVLGRLMDWYGTIWLHRGRVDRRALGYAVQAIREGRLLAIAPEGRYTLTHALERGGFGAAYLAAHAGVPIIPVGLTGTDNASVYGSLRRLRRPRIALKVGEPVMIPADDSAAALRRSTRIIMEAVARLLPVEIRGAYAHPSTH